MIRKSLMAGAGATLLAGMLFGRDAVSYLTTSAGWIQDTVKESIPLEFEIDRARNMVANLVPEIEQNLTVIAKEEVEVERLQRQIQQLEATQATERVNLSRLQSDLASGRETVQYGAQIFTAEQVRTELANRFERFKTSDATLASLQQILSARLKGLDAARKKMEGMLAAKRKLEVDVQNCEARLQMLEAAQTTSELSFDDSKLSRAKTLISDVQTRLDVAAKTVAAGETFRNEIPVGEPAPADIADQVAEFLKQSPGRSN